MNFRIKTIGLLLTPLVIGFSSVPLAGAFEKSSSHQHQELKAQSKGSIWLVVVGGVNYPYQGPTNISTIQMKSMEDCEAQGLKVKGNEDFRNGIFDDINYICIQGR